MEEDLHHSDRQRLSVRNGRKRNAGESKGRDALGVPVPLPEAAPGTWRAGLAYADRYLGDRALAAEIVEGVVDSAAKAHRNKPIKNPDSYLLVGIVRRVKKLLAREQRIEYRGSNFKATARPSLMSSALYTTPMPPPPNTSSTR